MTTPAGRSTLSTLLWALFGIAGALAGVGIAWLGTLQYLNGLGPDASSTSALIAIVTVPAGCGLGGLAAYLAARAVERRNPSHENGSSRHELAKLGVQALVFLAVVATFALGALSPL